MDLLWLSLFGSFGGLIGLFPLAWFSRRSLEADPVPASACHIANRVHVLVIPLLLAAIAGSISAARLIPLWRIPFPGEAGLALAILSLVFILTATLNLVAQGSGSPILVAFTRRLASSGLYARTRNPIILGGFLLLISLGLWMQSLFLVLWTVLLFLPTILYFLKTYEERELEIRFGESYREYRLHTPMFFPRLR